nr:probable inactive poly [ADP-ribose] polymerase SRO5 isoform X2 [Tanacetum cinerariifolium]
MSQVDQRILHDDDETMSYGHDVHIPMIEDEFSGDSSGDDESVVSDRESVVTENRVESVNDLVKLGEDDKRHGIIVNKFVAKLGEIGFQSVESAIVDDDGVKHILLCRVLLGKTEGVNRFSTQCHPISEEFDSGVDNAVTPKKYIIWSSQMNTHILPEFVISFKTQKIANRPQVNGVRLEKPVSPRIPIPELIEKLSKMLPPKSFKEITQYHQSYIQRDMEKGFLNGIGAKEKENNANTGSFTAFRIRVTAAPTCFSCCPSNITNAPNTSLETTASVYSTGHDTSIPNVVQIGKPTVGNTRPILYINIVPTKRITLAGNGVVSFVSLVTNEAVTNNVKFRSLDSDKPNNAKAENGTWFIRPAHIILKKWTPNANVLKEDLNLVLIWVRFHDIPIVGFTVDGLSVMATKLEDEAKKGQLRTKDLDTFIADVISSALSKVVATFSERREEEISISKTPTSAHANETDSSIHQQLRNRSHMPHQRSHMPHQRQPQRLTFDAPSQATYNANIDSRHRNYHVTTSQLSATILTRRPFARRPSNSKKLSYQFWNGRTCMDSSTDSISGWNWFELAKLYKFLSNPPPPIQCYSSPPPHKLSGVTGSSSMAKGPFRCRLTFGFYDNQNSLCAAYCKC